MTVFAVHYDYIDDAERVQAVRPEHREFLRERRREGTLALAGALGEGGRPGALLIVHADSADDALAVLDEDPFRREGIITGRRAREWNVAIGELPAA